MERRLGGWLPPLATAVAVLGLLWLLLGIVIYREGDAWGYDYSAYLEAAARLGETGTLYQTETLGGPYRPGPYGLYMYAPQLGIAVAPLSALDLDTGTTMWYMLHAVALILACAVMPVRVSLRLAVFGIAAFSFAVVRDGVLGNVSTLLLAPMAIAWRWLDHPLGSMAQAVAISIRPTLGILIVWQALRRRWAAIAWTLVTGLVLVMLTLPMVGVNGYADYIAVLRNMSGVTGVESNRDMSSTALTLGASEPLATMALICGYAVAIGAILLSLRRDREVGFMVTVTASLLLSPLLWDHYLAMLVLPAAFLAERGRPIAILLPLLSWMPSVATPAVVILATLLPFWARDAGSSDDASRAASPSRSTSPTVQASTAAEP